MTTIERIKEVARKQNLNLKTTAKKAGLSENAIYKWSSQAPNTNAIQAVSDVLGVSVDYLLGNTDDTMPVQKDPSKPLSETQEFTLMAAHWGTDINELPEQDRKKLMEKAKAYVLGAIDMLKD